MNRNWEQNLALIMERQCFVKINEKEVDYDGGGFYQHDDGQTIWNLESEIDTSIAIQMWCDQFENVNDKTVFVCFGLGEMGYILELTNRYPENVVLVYEPNENSIIRMCSDSRFELVKHRDNIILVGGEHMHRSFDLAIQLCIIYRNRNDVKYAEIPNYARIWSEEANFFKAAVERRIKNLYINRNTILDDEKKIAKNYISNLKYLVQGTGTGALRDALSEIEIKDYPVVIVSAGPSLDKNVKVLKEYEGKVFVMCVDAAVRTALRNGIHIDMIVSIDPIIDRLPENSEFGVQMPALFASIRSSSKIMDNYKGRKIFFNNSDPYVKMLLEDTKEKDFMIDTGGSVANVAFGIANALGFEKIILIGQDLAYPNNQRHAKDAFEGETLIEDGDTRYFYVKDIYGNQVLTEGNMNHYREWFQNKIRLYQHLEVIDATEGGALIEGTKIMTLREAMETYSAKENVDFEHMIRGAKYYYDKEKQDAKLREIENSRVRIRDHIAYLKDKKRLYSILDRLNKKGKYQSSEFKQTMLEIRQLTDYIENQKDMVLFEHYMEGVQYEVEDVINREENTVYDEIRKVVINGEKMIDAYIQSGEELLKDWESICEEEKCLI